MNNPIAQFFYVPKYGKVSEKMLTRHVFLTVIMIIFCLSSMAFAAYAYYACEVNSVNQVIQSTAYYCEITVDDTVYAEVMGGTTLELSLPAGTHTIQVKRLDKSATTGFLVIVAGEVNYHTQQVGLGGVNALSFSLILEQDLTIQMMPHWGTSSHYADYAKGESNEFYIQDTNTVTLKATHSMGEVEDNVSAAPTQPTAPSEPTEVTEPDYKLNETDITASVGRVTTLQLLDMSTNTPVTGLAWYVSEPDYISIEVMEDGVKVTGIANTVDVPGVLYGRVYCEYQGETYTCIFRIVDSQ